MSKSSFEWKKTDCPNMFRLNLKLPIFQKNKSDPIPCEEALLYTKHLTNNWKYCYLVWENPVPMTPESIQQLIQNDIKEAFILNSPYPFIPPTNLIPKEIPKDLVEKAGKMLFKIFQETSQNFSSVQKNMQNNMLWLLEEKKSEIEIPSEIESIIKNVVDVLCQKDNLIHLGSLSELNKEFEETTVHSLGVALRSALNGNYLMQNYPQIAQSYWLKTKKDLVELAMGGLLHDVGKILIPREILEKKEEITPEERTIVDTHSMLWYLLLSNNNQKQDLYARIAKEHHCNYGTVEPHSLHPFSQIIKIIDVIDALEEDRFYRDAKAPYYALKILIQDFKDKKYNPELFPLFYERILESTPSFLVQNLCIKISQENLTPIKLNLNIEAKNEDLYVIVLEPKGLTSAKCLLIEGIRRNWKLIFQKDKIVAKNIILELTPELKEELTGGVSILKESFDNVITNNLLVKNNHRQKIPK